MSFSSTAPKSPAIILYNCPTADFSVRNNNVSVGTPVIFDNNSTSGADYEWYFGDGETSTEMNPTHTYSNPGNYDVTLKVTLNGCTKYYIGTEDIVII